MTVVAVREHSYQWIF